MARMTNLKDKFVLMMHDLMRYVLVDGLVRDVECFFIDEKLDAWNGILTEEAYDDLAKHFGLCEFYYSDGIFLMHIDDAVFQMVAFVPVGEFVSSKYSDRGVYYEYSFVNDAREYRVLSYDETLSSERKSCMFWHNVDCESEVEGFQHFVLFMWQSLRSNVKKVRLLSQYFSDIERRWIGLFDE